MNGFVESIDVFSGKLTRILLVGDLETVPTYKKQAVGGVVEVSASIADQQVDYLEYHDVCQFLPYSEVVLLEVCNQIAEGKAISDLKHVRLGRYTLPPDHVIYMWMEHDSKFKVMVDQARRKAARHKFDQALKLALEAKEDPKALRVLVDILKRHAEVDDAEVFQIKSKEVEATPPVINITFNTGVPDPDPIPSSIDITPKVEQLESQD